MYKNFQKTTKNRSFKYSFVASFSIMALLFTFITNTAYGATTTSVTNVGDELIEPTGLAVDSSGDIYVADNLGNNMAVIKKIDISSNTTTTAAVGFKELYGLALDSSGNNIYVSDIGKSEIRKTDTHDGNPPTFFAELGSPRGIALDSSGNIYVASSGNIRKYSSEGTRDENFDINDNNIPYGVAVDSNGNTYVAYYSPQDTKCIIKKFDLNGNFISTIGEGILSDSCNKQIAVDNSDNIYILEINPENDKNIIYKMKTSGEMEVYASYALEDEIRGIAVDNDGNIYVTEGNYVKKITVSPELKIDTTNPPNATVGTTYSYTFTSTGGIGTKTYAVTGGSLPAGLTLSTEGTLSGIPNTIGGGTLTITVTDSAPIASTSSATVNLTVLVANSSGGSSSGSSSSSGSDSDSSSGSSSDAAPITATVTNDQFEITAPTLPVVITTETDGTKRGKLEIKENIAKEIVDSLGKKGEDTARVIIPDTKGKLSSLTASIPTAAIERFVNAGIKLELETPNGGVALSNQNMKDYANTSNQALYFTIAPVKDAMAQTETYIRAVKQQLEVLKEQLRQIQSIERLLGINSPRQQEIQQQIQQQEQQQEQLQQQLLRLQPARPTNGIINETKERKSELQGLSNDHSTVVGRSVDINSNMPHGISVGIRIPMGIVTSPAQEAKLKKDSASYAIFAEHSLTDIESLLINQISIKNMTAIAEGNTNRFSRFTIIRLSQNTTDVGNWKNDEQGWKYIRNGQPATGWNQIGGSWYLMDSEGIMQTGWKQTNGQWYYLYNDGAMASNTVIDGFQLGENGAWLYN